MKTEKKGQPTAMRETIADIADEIRRAVESMGDEMPYTVSAGTMRRVADRIEAAGEREKSELVYAYDPTKRGNGRAQDGSAYALESMREPVTVSHAIGNAAALREAMETILSIANTFMAETRMRHVTDSARVDVGVIEDVAKAALAAPARNCDVEYVDNVEMYGEFKDWCKSKGHTMEPMLAYDAFDWLLAPVAGLDGGRDGTV